MRRVRLRTIFQPTRPLRGATDQLLDALYERGISTHAPLAGRDAECRARYDAQIYFNPRAPCGARPKDYQTTDHKHQFQPTRPLRGATKSQHINPIMILFQPTRPLRGATYFLNASEADMQISTHAPLAGRDSKSVHITMYIFAITDKFQMLLHKMPPVRALCFFSMQKNHADLGANRPGDLCALALRTIRSSAPREDTSAYSQSVRFYSRTSCPGSKTAGCPFPGR